MTALACVLSQGIVAQAAPDEPALRYKLAVTSEIERAFRGSDGIDIHEITGTTSKFQVGGIYRITGTCHQATLKNAELYIGNTSEPGPDAIIPIAGPSLQVPLTGKSTDFDIIFKVLRPGILHVTIYDMDNYNPIDNAYAGIYLGDAVFKH
jgi:hypothetical protein